MLCCYKSVCISIISQHSLCLRVSPLVLTAKISSSMSEESGLHHPAACDRIHLRINVVDVAYILGGDVLMILCLCLTVVYPRPGNDASILDGYSSDILFIFIFLFL